MEEDRRKLTRWQLRVEKGLEEKIRNKCREEKRSINGTVTLILEKYFADLEQTNPETLTVKIQNINS